MSARRTNAQYQAAYRARKAAAAGQVVQSNDPYLDGRADRDPKRCTCTHRLVVDPDIPTCLFCGRSEIGWTGEQSRRARRTSRSQRSGVICGVVGDAGGGGMTAASQLLPLDADRARQLTDEVKADAAALWAKLLQLYEGNAHKALGYTSWAKYCRTEF